MAIKSLIINPGSTSTKIGVFEDETLLFEKTLRHSTEEIAKQDYILTPGRYVGIEEKEDDDEPFDQKMTRLTTELGQMFEQSHKLEEEIKKNLEGIGFKI